MLDYQFGSLVFLRNIMTRECVDRKCPFCNRIFRRGLWDHIASAHPECKLDKYEILTLIHGLDKPPECAHPKCHKRVRVNYKRYRFGEFCSDSCATSVRMVEQVKDKNYCKKMGDNLQRGLARWRKECPDEVFDAHSRAAKKSCNIERYWYANREKCIQNFVDAIANWRTTRYDDFVEIQRELGRRSVSAAATDKKSKHEFLLFDRLVSLFPGLRIVNDFQIYGYKPDITFLDLKLIIEVDGYPWHHGEKIDDDLARDKRIYSKGYRIRRVDATYSLSLSDGDLYFLIFNEIFQELPYWERIPYEQIGIWKWNVYQTGPFRLLTYEH